MQCDIKPTLVSIITELLERDKKSMVIIECILHFQNVFKVAKQKQFVKNIQ